MDIREINLQDITLESFDRKPPKHTFSPGYKKRKREMLRQFKRESLRANRVRYTREAVAAAALIVVMPFAVNAATGGTFFENLWGTGSRTNVTAHEETLYDEEKGTSTIVTVPEKEYVETDAEKAEELLGENQIEEPIVTQIGDVTMTLLSAVTDGNAAAVEFTLEQEGGVSGLSYSEESNNYKGASFTADSNFYFDFYDYAGSIFVDLERSTADKLYCYDYMVPTWREADELSETASGNDTASQSLTLETHYYPSGRSEGEEEDPVDDETILIPVTAQLATTKFTNESGGSLAISPISLYLPNKDGLGLPESSLTEPSSVYYICITYQDGSTYLVMDSTWEALSHIAETETNNTYYICGGMDEQVYLIFNRLVDVEQIASVTLNETTYTAAEN